MNVTPNRDGYTRLITSTIPGGRVVREHHVNGHERAFRKRDGIATVHVCYGTSGPWLVAEVNEVPDDIWHLLIGDWT